jgi:two-component system, NtrC family, sensor kinase
MNLNKTRALLLVGWLCLLTLPVHAQAEEKGWLYLPTENQDPASLDSVLQVWEERESLSVFQAVEKYIAGEFNFMSGHYLDHDQNENPLWVVVPVRILESNQSDWALSIVGQSPLDLKMWLLDGKLNVIERYHTGSAHPYNTRPLDERVFAVPLSLRAQGELYVVFRMTLPGSSLISFDISRVGELLEGSAKDALIRSIYVGLGVMMMCYALFVSILMRRKDYLVYAFYVACIIIAPLGDSELLHRYLWPSSGDLNVRAPFVASLLGGFFASLFVAQLFEINKQSTRLWGLFKVSMVIALSAACLALVIDYKSVVLLSMSWGSLLALFLVSVCFERALRGSRLARLLSLGWLSHLLGIGIFVAHSRGVFSDSGWLDYTFLIGSSLEMVFFSLAIPLGLGVVIRDKGEMLAELSFISSRYEEASKSVTNAEVEIKSLSELLEQEHYDLQRLTGGYERALISLGKAEQKLAQAEKLASLGQLIVGVSDDLGTKAGDVLLAAKELSQAIEEVALSGRETLDPKDPRTLELNRTVESMRRMLVFLEKGAHAIQRMNQALSHYAGGEDESVSDLGLAEICEDIRLIVHGRIRQHKFEQDIPSDLRLVAKRSEVERVLGNLLTNASDAISDSPAELQADEELGVIRLSAKEVVREAREWVVIEVEDTGGGIPDESRDEVILPFMTTKTLHRGTGLGLFTADGILREHGGHIEIAASETLGGAKISLWFPVVT